jgi:hypothetical protein
MMTRMPAPSPFDAKSILKAELKRRGMTYGGLVEALAGQGVSETEANLRNKISRGSFTAEFFLKCLVAIGCDYVALSADRATLDRLALAQPPQRADAA